MILKHKNKISKSYGHKKILRNLFIIIWFLDFLFCLSSLHNENICAKHLSDQVLFTTRPKLNVFINHLFVPHQHVLLACHWQPYSMESTFNPRPTKGNLVFSLSQSVYIVLNTRICRAVEEISAKIPFFFFIAPISGMVPFLVTLCIWACEGELTGWKGSWQNK